MVGAQTIVAGAIAGLREVGEPVVVSLSNELVGLLSDQLYQSPVKAIEELVINSYDADAKECRIFVPSPDDDKTNYIVMYDNGVGMDRDGLVNLWQIGRSNKREIEIQKRRKRKQIGRFGIGKLATYAVANQLTYITKSNGRISRSTSETFLPLQRVRIAQSTCQLEKFRIGGNYKLLYNLCLMQLVSRLMIVLLRGQSLYLRT
jgi:hypothetical protein